MFLDEHMTRSRTQTTKTINFKLCRSISKQDSEQKHAWVFPSNESFVFYCYNSTRFESAVFTKTVESRLCKNYLTKKTKENRGHDFVYPFVDHISVQIKY